MKTVFLMTYRLVMGIICAFNLDRSSEIIEQIEKLGQIDSMLVLPFQLLGESSLRRQYLTIE